MASYPDDIPLSILFGSSDKMITRQKKVNYSDQNDDDFVEDEQVLRVNNHLAKLQRDQPISALLAVSRGI